MTTRKEITLEEFMAENNIGMKKVNMWIEKGLLPVTRISEGKTYLAYGARTFCQIKSRNANHIYASILYNSNKRRHIVPESFIKTNMSQEEFESYINQLAEKKLIKIRKCCDLYYYDLGVNAFQLSGKNYLQYCAFIMKLSLELIPLIPRIAH